MLPRTLERCEGAPPVGVSFRFGNKKNFHGMGTGQLVIGFVDCLLTTGIPEKGRAWKRIAFTGVLGGLLRR
jgi:hypothetical protein